MTTDRQPLPPVRPLSRPGWPVAEGTAIALVICCLADLAGVALKVRSSSSARSVGAAEVAFVAVLVGLAAWGLLRLLEPRVANPKRTWTGIATVVLAVSLIGPVVDGVGTAATIVLLALHLGVGCVLIAPLPARP